MGIRIRKKLVIPLCLAIFLIGGYFYYVKHANRTIWVPIGNIANGLESLAQSDGSSFRKEIDSIPYRLLAWGSDGKANVDLPELTLRIQGGQAYRKLALVGIWKCYAPDVIDGLPVVQCELRGGGTVHISGDMQTRNALLHIDSRANQFAYAVVSIVGVRGWSTPVLIVQ